MFSVAIILNHRIVEQRTVATLDRVLRLIPLIREQAPKVVAMYGPFSVAITLPGGLVTFVESFRQAAVERAA